MSHPYFFATCMLLDLRLKARTKTSTDIISCRSQTDLPIMVTRLPTVCHFPSSVVLRLKITELCYIVRYAAKNGRKSGTPWSIRQTAVYQQFDSRSNRTCWIFVQPSASFRAQVKRYLGRKLSFYKDPEHLSPIGVHLMLFDSTELEWRAYINYLEQQLTHLVRTPCAQLSEFHFIFWGIVISHGMMNVPHSF